VYALDMFQSSVTRRLTAMGHHAIYINVTFYLAKREKKEKEEKRNERDDLSRTIPDGGV
jgi:hypothetical protein